MKIFSQQSGFVMLLGVLVVGAVGVTIAVSLTLLGLGSSRSSLTLEKSSQAKALANTCAEHALSQIRLSEEYSGEETKQFSEGTCTIEPIHISEGSGWLVRTSGTVDGVTRRVEVMIEEVTPQLIVSSWEEVADYFDQTLVSDNTSCASLKKTGSDTDGVYEIDPDGDGPTQPFNVYCDMTRDGGGWTLVMRIADSNFPGRDWATTDGYQVGFFNDSSKSFKYADEQINAIKGNRYRIDAFDGSRYFDGACTYTHNAYNKSSSCGVSYSDVDLSVIKLNSTGSTDNRVQGIGDLRDWRDGLNNHIQTHVTYCEGRGAAASNGFPNCDDHWSVQCGQSRSGSNNCRVDRSKNNFTMWVGQHAGGSSGAPTITELSPADDSTNVAIDTNLSITFNEAVKVKTGNIHIKRSDGVTVETIDVTSDKVFFEGSTLEKQVGEGGTASLSCAGDSTISSYTSTYGKGCSRCNGGEGVDCGSCTIGSNSCSITYSSRNCGGDCHFGCHKPGNLSITCSPKSGDTILINPSSDLKYDTSYYIEIDAGAFTDLVGAEFGGITSNTAWSFTTDTSVTVRTSCAALKENGYDTDGVYTVDPDGEGPIQPFKVYCDMTRDGGGWTRVMRVTSSNFPGSGWNTTGDWQENKFNNSSRSFKYSDAKINTIKGNRYRIDTGSTSRFFDGACTYRHTSHDKSAACGISYNDVNLTSVKRDSTTGSPCAGECPDYRLQGIGDLTNWRYPGDHVQTHVTYCGRSRSSQGGGHWTRQCNRSEFTMWVGEVSGSGGGGSGSGTSTNTTLTKHVSENRTATLTCPSGMTISSYTSTYGKGCSKCNGGAGINTSSSSKGRCTIGKRSCSITYNNRNFGDCHWGCVKPGDLSITCTSSGSVRGAIDYAKPTFLGNLRDLIQDALRGFLK